MTLLLAQIIIAFDIGHRLADQLERLGRRHRRRGDRFSVDQPIEQIEDMGLGRNASLQRHGDRRQHQLLIMMKNQRQYFDHFPVAAGIAQQMSLQTLERIG